MLREYFLKKGLSSQDIFNADGIVLKDKVFYGKPSDWQKRVQDVLKYKGQNYAKVGINEAVFLPIYNLYGEFCGFVVRKMHTVDKQDSHILDEFDKKNLLYNLHNAKDSIIANDRVYVVEGPYDCLRLVKAGLTNTVSLLGTAFTKSHAILIKQFTDNITLCLDGDSAGQKTVSKIYKKHSSLFTFNIINVPLDPDEYVNKFGIQSYLANEMLYTKYLDELLKEKI